MKNSIHFSPVCGQILVFFIFFEAENNWFCFLLQPVEPPCDTTQFILSKAGHGNNPFTPDF